MTSALIVDEFIKSSTYDDLMTIFDYRNGSIIKYYRSGSPLCAKTKKTADYIYLSSLPDKIKMRLIKKFIIEFFIIDLSRWMTITYASLYISSFLTDISRTFEDKSCYCVKQVDKHMIITIDDNEIRMSDKYENVTDFCAHVLQKFKIKFFEDITIGSCFIDKMANYLADIVQNYYINKK